MKKFLLPLTLFMFSSFAQAQEYGLLVGFHQTTASTDSPNTTASGVLNWKFGLNMAFELVPNMRFKTGAIYNERHVDYKTTSPTEYKSSYDFAFIDIPVNVQYNFNEMVGLFGGLIIGANVNDHVRLPTGMTATNVDAKKLIALADVGVNFMFADMIGFDLYFERGLGDYANHASSFNTFGGNFIYWF